MAITTVAVYVKRVNRKDFTVKKRTCLMMASSLIMVDVE